MWNRKNMIRTVELKDTDKTVRIEVVEPLRDGYNDEMLYSYTDYLMDELKHYHEDIEDMNTLDDVLLVLGEIGKEEKENRITFKLNVWEVKEEFYNYFSEYNFIVHYDEDTYFKEVDIENYEHLGLVTVQCEFSIEDY
ncbi:hypothetical protein B8A44_07470 [Dolosigranulum pigrum]|uniref:Uncharacterized protein n=1 Tax=Dolosigranulum pigrum TaxID=29394 RepID=A0A328KHJ8_9LACT|nr:hypothetical protein [Dolosigranulum pigrum]RAN62378.1 hypothetical protein B8A44_07470 [Dolosigranulum pigrum]